MKTDTTPMKNVPEKIYLQIDADGETPEDFEELEGVSWCTDRINENDIEYVRLLSLPADGVVTRDEIEAIILEWLKSGNENCTYVAHLINQRYAPTIAMLKSRVSELEETVLLQNKQVVELGRERESLNGKLEIVQDQLDACLLDLNAEKEKSRENAINFLDWYKENGRSYAMSSSRAFVYSDDMYYGYQQQQQQQNTDKQSEGK